jgi:nicotinamide-nucleotide amidase
MEAIVNRIHKSLLKKRKTIAVAESCTGGLLSSLLTKEAGSSKYFIGGVIAYSNKVKEDILKIPRSVIAKKGAVSEPVVKLMAKRIRKMAKTDFGIGITGIAGPAGGTTRKPVGTVFIAIDSKDKKISKKFHFTGSRIAIREKTALKSLELLESLL